MFVFGCVGLWCFVVVSMVVLILDLLWWCWCWFMVRIDGGLCGG